MLPGQVSLGGGRKVAAYGGRSYDRKANLDGSLLSYQSSSASGLLTPRGTVVEM
jgi:hypothetical protein